MENIMEKKIDFLTLYQRLFQILSCGNMQELMNVSYEITGVPILAVDIGYNLLGVVSREKQEIIIGIILWSIKLMTWI